MKVEIYGASDDCIEVEGDIREEFSAERGYLACSDGTLLSIAYGEDAAFWRIARISKGNAKFAKHEATDEDEDYSDRVTLIGNLKWIVFSEAKPATK